MNVTLSFALRAGTTSHSRERNRKIVLLYLAITLLAPFCVNGAGIDRGGPPNRIGLDAWEQWNEAWYHPDSLELLTRAMFREAITDPSAFCSLRVHDTSDVFVWTNLLVSLTCNRFDDSTFELSLGNIEQSLKSLKARMRGLEGVERLKPLADSLQFLVELTHFADSISSQFMQLNRSDGEQYEAIAAKLFYAAIANTGNFASAVVADSTGFDDWLTNVGGSSFAEYDRPNQGICQHRLAFCKSMLQSQLRVARPDWVQRAILDVLKAVTCDTLTN